MLQEFSTFQHTRQTFENGIIEGLHLGAQIYISVRGQTQLDTSLGQSSPNVSMEIHDRLLWLSAGKPLTAIGLGILLEKKSIPVHTPVRELIPEFSLGGKESVTLHHLLTHTGGFRTADQLDEKLPWDEMIAAICGTPLENSWIPGEKAGYHIACSWYLLGEIIQRLSGGSFTEFIHRELLRPMGMSETELNIPTTSPDLSIANFPSLYNTWGGEQKAHNEWNSIDFLQRQRPGSNVRGPIRDLGRFYESLLGYGEPKGSTLSKSMIQQFTSRHRAGLYDHTLKGQVDWGYGFLIQPLQKGPLPLPYTYGIHASPETFGHSGNQCSCAFADPKNNLVVAWICNGRPGEILHQKRANAINDAIYHDLEMAS